VALHKGLSNLIGYTLPEERTNPATFPGEIFRVLKEKEIRTSGEYRTRRLVLEAWETLLG
jgi:hypothetical protein